MIYDLLEGYFMEEFKYILFQKKKDNCFLFFLVFKIPFIILHLLKYFNIKDICICL